MLSRMKWFLSNKYANRKTDALKKDKYTLWRSFNLRYLLSLNLYINTDNRDILSHILNKIILVITPYSHKDGSSKIELIIHVLLSGKKSRAKYCRIALNKDYTMYYITNSRSITRKYLNILELIRNEGLITI